MSPRALLRHDLGDMDRADTRRNGDGDDMRILITNDDGINAPGLSVAEEIAHNLAGDQGEIWTVAPAFEQSGVGHCISYSHPTMVAKLGPRRFAAEGSPADCVLAALYDILSDTPPDLVLSGVNRGNNAGENVMYSGTVGGAMEAALQGLPAIALSQYLGPRSFEIDDPFAPARHHGAAVIQRILDLGAWDTDADYGLFYNVNFPATDADEVTGVAAAPQGRRRDVRFGVKPYTAPNGRRFMWISGGGQHGTATAGSDVDLCLQGQIAVTPMRATLGADDALGALATALDGALDGPATP